MHLEVRLVRADHLSLESGHAGLLLESKHHFLLVVRSWSNSRSCALLWDAVNGAVVKALVLAEGSPPRLRLAHVLELIQGHALVRAKWIVSAGRALFGVPILQECRSHR